MILHFYLKYRTEFGQQIFLIADGLPSGEKSFSRLPLQYVSDEYWDIEMRLPDDFNGYINYYYVVENAEGLQIFDGEECRFLDLTRKKKDKKYTIIDRWNDAASVNNVFFTKAFRDNLFHRVSSKGRHSSKPYTHEFRVKAPVLNVNEVICLIGSTTHLRGWDTDKPIIMTSENDWFVARLRLDENEWPASYKYGIYDISEKMFVRYEDGENRLLTGWELDNGTTILNDGFINIQPISWRGAGINVPVFSLRSKNSFGAGEFSDLKLLIDWCRQTGISMIQLLPVNDTSANDNWHDSYPYAAISAFALHPLYINLEKVAGKAHAAIIKKLSRKQKQLNALPQVDYEQVMKFKRLALRELYDLQKRALKDNKDYCEFFETNKHWLVPYAAFCYLKKKYGTTDFKEWKRHSVYDGAIIQKLVTRGQKNYDDVAIYYYEQYHLHIQLNEMAEYARKHKIILKGDLPIGIYRYSCDAWIAPSLYNLDQQAGAPPDDFAAEGQNWGFPTYNWSKMKETRYEWWRKRFHQLSNYFDAFRIDHILGFFRIWSIPVDAVDGIMGRFVPALPVDISEFEQNRIYFDRKRYCMPYITDEILEEIFGERAEDVADKLLKQDEDGTYLLRDFVNTQRKALLYLKQNGLEELKSGIFQLIGNVILFEEEGASGTKFHFRIDIQKTLSFRKLDDYTQGQLIWLYNNYYFERQDYFWRKQAMEKLPQLKRSTRMLVCGEDLGMVPDCVPRVMHDLGILGLNVQRMPKTLSKEFFHPDEAAYLSIVQPSTHDMSTIREWWGENPDKTRRFYNQVLGHEGDAPAGCDVEIVKEIILQHLKSPAMWSVFLMQDLLAMNEKLRVDDPSAERINIPSNPDHYWRYRMNAGLEDLLKEKGFTTEIRDLIKQGGRLHDN